MSHNTPPSTRIVSPVNARSTGEESDAKIVPRATQVTYAKEKRDRAANTKTAVELGKSLKYLTKMRSCFQCFATSMKTDLGH